MNSLSNIKTLVFSTAAAVLLLTAGPIHSALTPVNNNTAGEPSLINNTPGFTSIMNTLYGAGNYSRIDDSIDRVFQVISSPTAVAVAKYAGNTNTFGYVNGSSGVGVFVPVLKFTGNGYNPTVTIQNPFTPTTPFTLGLNATGNNNTLFSSVPSVNADTPVSRDHMVTFLITSGAAAGSYVVAFEDTLAQTGSDFDYNDAVIQIGGISTSLGVPEPGTYLLLGSFLALGLVMANARKRVRAS